MTIPLYTLIEGHCQMLRIEANVGMPEIHLIEYRYYALSPLIVLSVRNHA